LKFLFITYEIKMKLIEEYTKTANMERLGEISKICPIE